MTDERVAGLLDEVGLPAADAGRVELTGADPVLPTPFRIGEAAATALGACAAVTAGIWADRTGEDQEVRVDVARAATSLIGFVHQRLLDPGASTPMRADARALVAMYECGDGRWVHLHGGLRSLQPATTAVLGLPDDPPAGAVAEAVARWEGQALEDALAAAGTCGALVRTPEEWAAHPQAAALAPLGRVDLERIGDAPPEPAGAGPRPLSGVRVLDLTRILAGPTHGRVLAEQGADVLLVNGPHLENVAPFVLDTGHGKRSALVDLRTDAGVETLRGLVRSADVFCQGYRGGALARRGFDVEQLASLRPGIVAVSISCYGAIGPWAHRPGWEQLAQCVSGIAAVQGSPERPALLPAAGCDYTTGYLAALGSLAALRRRATEGGSWHVRVSLCQTAQWFLALGADRDPAAAAGPTADDLAAWSVETDTPHGRLRHLAPVAQLATTPARWDLPTVPLGTHDPVWD